MMSRWRLISFCAIAAAAIAAPTSLLAQEIGPASDTTRFVFDSLLLLAGGFAALLGVLGLAMRDIGVARVQNAPSVCLRSAGAYAIAAIMFWLTGYGLAFSVEAGGLLGEFSFWRNEDIDPVAAGSAAGARWYFLMGLAAIAATIVSGAVSERVKLWPFLVFAIALTGLILPIVISWVWGGGYLATAWRFADHGGAAVIHVSAGAAALAAVLAVGPRPGKYDNGALRLAPTTALPMTLLGLAFFWIAMLIINAARQGGAATVEDVISIAAMTVNASLAASAGLLAALFLTQIIYKRASLIAAMSGAAGGLVAIAGDPLYPAIWQALLIGGVGGVIVTVAPPFLDRFRLDDATGAVPAHLICGAWSVVIVAWTNPDAWLIGQLAGVAMIAGFSFFVSLLIWTALKYTSGVRLAPPDAAPGGAAV